MNEAVETREAHHVEPPRRVPLGQRGKAQTAETKQRIVGDPRVPILDVAAFNSFIG